MRTIIIILSLSLTIVAQSQIGIGKIKSKTTEKVFNTGNSGSGAGNQDESEKEKIAISKSPASSVIWDFKIAIKSFEDAPTGPRALDELAKAETKLAAIKKQDPNFSYIRDYEKRIEQSKKNRDTKLAEGASIDELRAEIIKMSSEAEEIKYSTPFFELRRSRFDSLDVAYTKWKAKGNKASNLDEKMTLLNNYYGQNEESNVTKIIDIYTKELEKAMRYVKAKRQAADFQKSFEEYKFNEAREELIKANKMYQSAILVFPKNEKLINTVKQYKEVSDDLNTFKNDGELNALLASKNAAYLASKRMPKNLMTDAEVTACLKKELLKHDKYKAVKRIVITNDAWQFQRNAFGVIIRKYVYVEFAYTAANGKCFFTQAVIEQQYNGSSYEAMRADVSGSYDGVEILCENVNK